MDILINLLVHTLIQMGQLRNKEIVQKLKDIEDFLLDEYKESRPSKKRDWRTYEQQLMRRIKNALKNLEGLIDESIRTIKVQKGKGRKPKLTLKQKVTLLLLKEIVDKSNRNMAFMLSLFSVLSDIDVSYKTVERLYSDPEVMMAIHNLHLLIMRERGIEKVDTCGDGTGYSLTISKHYATEAHNRKEKAKEKGDGTKNAFVYSFNMMDLGTKLYICYGTSLKSEKEAFDRAMTMLTEMNREHDLNITSVRLDRYYSSSSYVDQFPDSKVYIIPKKNSTLNGSWHWKRIVIDFVRNTLPYLGQYYRRCNSEAGFSADKRLLGWKINLRREDRIDTALSCHSTWHNLLNLYPG
jgi:transposase